MDLPLTFLSLGHTDGFLGNVFNATVKYMNTVESDYIGQNFPACFVFLCLHLPCYFFEVLTLVFTVGNESQSYILS